MYDIPPADRLGELVDEVRAAGPHQPGAAGLLHGAQHARRAVRQPEVRQALNFAIDRDAVIKIFGGPALASATCQILPPDFPGYQPYCPYTQNPGEKWTAPDLAKAKQLVDASGTKGQKVTIITTNDETTKAIDLYFVSLLRELGYDAGIKSLNGGVQYAYVQDSSNKAQMSYSYWFAGLPGGLELLQHRRRLQRLRARTARRARTSPGSATRRSRPRPRQAMKLADDRPATRRTSSGRRSTRRRPTPRRGSRCSSPTGSTSSPSGSATTSSTRRRPAAS